MKTRLLPLAAAVALLSARAAVPDPVPLYPSGSDVSDEDRSAAIWWYPAPKDLNTGQTVVVCPGGGYRVLCIGYEGHDVAAWLNSIGVNAVVLRYRMSKGGFRHPVPLDDVRRAIRTVRLEGVDRGMLPDRVGVMGFSAGGHLAALASVRFDDGDPSAADPVERQSSRPDFSILCYPVVRFDPDAPSQTARSLLGEDPARDLLALCSAERHVTRATPPAFLYQCTADEKVDPSHALAYYAACRRADVPAELHVFADGLHGAGLALDDPLPRRGWSPLLARWLASLLPAERTKMFPARLETADWQAKIDAAAAAGGGRVSVPAGRHLVGGLLLRDNVELHLEAGAVLEGSSDAKDYRRVVLPNSEGDWMAVVMALGATNVAVTGRGEIFGNGSAWPQPETFGGNQEGRRPRGLFFNACRGVRLEDFTLRDAACWGIVLRVCDGVTARRVRIDSHANLNNDGFDIESRNVLVEDCDVDADDDAYCLKSNSAGFDVENVVVRRCVARSNCNAFKLGTASHGAMRHVVFEDSRVEPSRRSFLSATKGEWMPPFGEEWYCSRRCRPWTGQRGLAAISGVAVECVDGGETSDVVVRNVEMRGVATPVFVRGGMRQKRGNGAPRGTRNVLSDVLVENVRAEAASFIASSVTGAGACRPRNVTLRNVTLVCRGAGENAAERTRPVPEAEGAYPEANMFGCMLPAWGVYVRHADGVVFDNVKVSLAEGTSDRREPFVFDDATVETR